MPQLLLTAYDIVVFPAATPRTTPLPLTVATVVVLLLHVPPPIELLSVVLAPGHTVNVPVIDGTEGILMTVTVAVPVFTQPLALVPVIV